MFEMHVDECNLTKLTPVQSFSSLKTAVNYMADFRRSLKKAGQRAPRMWFVDTKATRSYETPNPANKRKPAVFVRCPTDVPYTGPQIGDYPF